DHSRTWKKMGVKLYLKYKVENSLNNRQAGHDPSIYINSTSRYFLESLEGIPFLIVLLVLVATLVLTYFLMYFEARRVFGLNLMGKELMGAPLNEVPKSDKTGDPILYRVRELVEVGSDAAILCQNREQLKRYITLSGDRFVPQTGGDAGDRSTINYRFKDINFAELAPAEEKDNKNAEKDSNGQTLPIIRINNFELDYHNIDNSENLEKDLRRVEELLKLLETPGIRVIIPMIQPLPEIIALYHQGFAGLPVKGKKDEKPQEMRQLEVTVEKLTRRLNEADKFLIPLVVPLKFENEPAPVYKKINAIAEPSIKQMILNEFKPSSYFKSIEAAVYRYYKRLKTGKFNKELEPGELEEVEAKIILEIQELARLYYYKLLKSCTRHEKFVLYDIAQDMLINPNSRETTTILLKKGLLVYDGTFKFMNESFRNYILSTIDTEEARQLIGGLSLQGRWKTYKAPIYLLIFGAVVFFAFQRELMSDLDAVITTLVGGVAILTKFSGVLSGLSFGKKK
ncbi:MAG: hypothetical protein GY940_40800, partial [bacterium]|nr:hypothetical protein [bacterium]